MNNKYDSHFPSFWPAALLFRQHRNSRINQRFSDCVNYTSTHNDTLTYSIKCYYGNRTISLHTCSYLEKTTQTEMPWHNASIDLLMLKPHTSLTVNMKSDVAFIRIIIIYYQVTQASKLWFFQNLNPTHTLTFTAYFQNVFLTLSLHSGIRNWSNIVNCFFMYANNGFSLLSIV